MSVTGKVYVCIEQKDNERFLNLMRMRGLRITDVRYDDDKVSFCISANDFKELKDIFHKTGIKPRIDKKTGINFRIKKVLKFKSIIFGLIIFLGYIFAATRIVWNVELENNYRIGKEEVMTVLNKNGIYPGRLKKSVNCLEIENIIRISFNDISFVSARIEGGTLFIKIKENTIEESNKRKFGTKDRFNEPIDFIKETAWTKDKGALVAPCDGTIYSIVTSQGVPKAKKGDEVKAGQVLIDGVINIYDDFGEIIDTKEVLAKGEVYILGEFSYKSTVGLRYQKKVYTERKKLYYLRYEDYKLILYKPFNISGNCDIMFNEYNLGLKNDVLNRIHLGEHSYMEYNLYDEIYSDSEAKDILAKEFNMSVESLYEQEKYLRDFSLSYKKHEDTLELSGEIQLLVKANHYCELVWDNTKKGEDNKVGN